MRSFRQMRDDRYIGAIVLLGDVMWGYNTITKTVRDGRRDDGLIGHTGCQVFRCLAEKKGAFLRPVPYQRKAFIDEVILSGGAIDAALKRLGEQGLVTLSKAGQTATVQLHMPPHVFALYQQHANQIAVSAGSGSPSIEQHELDAALTMFDEPGFERFMKRRNAWRQKPQPGE